MALFVLFLCISVWTYSISYFTDNSAEKDNNYVKTDNNYVISESNMQNFKKTVESKTKLVPSLENDSPYPSGLCVNEYSTKICELGYGDEMTKNIGNQTFAIKGNKYICYDSKSDQFLTYNTNGQAPLKIKPTDYVFCVSDFGDIETNRNTYVKKYWNTIYKNDSNYYVNSSYDKCVWTSAGGSASIPYIKIADSYEGPLSGEYFVKAFCLNGSNQVDIYTFE